MGRPPLDRKTKRAAAQNMIHSAEQLIEEGGIGQVTIRKIASRAEVNSAALYHYFTDVDELLVFACMDVMRSLSQNVDEMKESLDGADPMARYTKVWEALCSGGFRNPELTRHVLFGKHSGDIDGMAKKYLIIFPEQGHEEDTEPDPDCTERLVQAFNFRADIQRETASAMQREADDPNVELVSELMMGYYRMLLSEMAGDGTGTYSVEHQTSRMLRAANYLLEQKAS